MAKFPFYDNIYLSSPRFRASSSRKMTQQLQLSRNNLIGYACYAGYYPGDWNNEFSRLNAGSKCEISNKPHRHVFFDTAINSRYSSKMYERKRRWINILLKRQPLWINWAWFQKPKALHFWNTVYFKFLSTKKTILISIGLWRKRGDWNLPEK